MHLLDTNIVSHVIRGDQPRVRDRLQRLPVGMVAISAVTEGELRYGLARRGYPKGLTQRVEALLLRVDILPWDTSVAQTYGRLRAACEAAGTPLAALDMMIASVAQTYGRLRAACEAAGTPLAALDMMIAAHAVCVDATLVSRDRVFARVLSGLKVEAWLDEDEIL